MGGKISVGRIWKHPLFLLGAVWALAGRPADLLAQNMAIPPYPTTAGVCTAGGVDGAMGANGIVPVGCSCGGSLPPPMMDGGGGGCATCGGGGGGGGCCGCCYAGSYGCDCCCDEYSGCMAKLLCGLYHCICCPDPCYEPHWVPLANAGFFIDDARPVTQMRLATDFTYNLRLPDKSEWFWAQENMKGPSAAGSPVPGAPVPAAPAAGTAPGERRLPQDRELYFLTEAAVDKFSFFVEMSYRNYQGDLFPGQSGLGDMNIGTKSLLLDCELAQFTFQFKTFLPTGNVTRGLGNGHVSLEPSFLGSLKLTPDCYLQGELAYWAPIGGDTSFEGDVFHYHLSLNYLLWKCGCDIQLIGTLECGGYEILSGQYTDPATGLSFRAADVGDIFNVGCGLRLSICNKIDFGVGYLHSLTDNSMNGEETIRAEFRWRF